MAGALAELFRAFAHEDVRPDGAGGGRSQPSVVACSHLREALGRANPRIGERAPRMFCIDGGFGTAAIPMLHLYWAVLFLL